MRLTSLLVALLVAFAATPALAQTGGPDAYGYEYAPATYDFVPLAGGLGTPLVLGDDDALPFALPFVFDFYGVGYETVFVTANGGLRFVDTTFGFFIDGCWPDAADGHPDVAVLWDDLNPLDGGGVYGYVDTAEDRVILSWEGVPHFGDIGAASVQAHLYATGEIQLHWSDVTFGDPLYDAGAAATVGIQDHSGGTAVAGNVLEWSCDTATVAAAAATSFTCPAGDGDGDGLWACSDCDDTNAAIFPGNPEICDGLDNDCDPTTTEAVDVDGDGVTTCGGDCDDDAPANFPGNPEICDGLDNDCGGDVDEDFDGDGDGFYEGVGCLAAWSVEDCDDSEITVFPGAVEVCGDVVDNDCSGVPDDGFVTLAGTGAGAVLPDPTLGADLYFGLDVAIVSAIADVDVDVNITHSWDADLELFLHSPLGTVVELVSGAGGSGDDYTDTLFDDEAAAPITSGAPPFTGSFQPSGVLADFDLEDSFGLWQLEMIDTVPAVDDGVLNSWSVTLTVDGTPDDDNDGWTLCEGDCDDDDDTANPGETEICDGGDNDCDGDVDEAFGDADGDGAADCVDCGVSDPLIFPGAFEACDGLDNDCDGLLDSGNPDVDGQETDDDLDGVSECEGDCDDADDTSLPGGTEVCDGADNDCIPATDELVDGDADTFAVCDDDCDDAVATTYPGAPELCNAVDDDCDIDVDEDFDGDLDGFYAGVGCAAAWPDPDCDDTDDAIYPGAPEVCFNGVDDDCSGAIDELQASTEGDGEGTPIPDNGPVVAVTANVTAAGAILDVNVTVDITHTWAGDIVLDLVSPSGTVVSLTANHGGSGDNYTDTTFDDEAFQGIAGGAPPFTGSFQPDGVLGAFDGEVATGLWSLELSDTAGADVGTLNSWSLDISIDGSADLDSDGYSGCEGDCDDDDDTVNPAAAEVCDGADNNCDGAIDEGFPDLDGDGAAACAGDCDDEEPAVSPLLPEVCDGLDNDCNGFDDAGNPGIDGEETDDDLDGVFECDGDCDDAEILVFPGNLEVCDGLDNDCDVATDENVDDDLDTQTECDGDCDDDDVDISTLEIEACNAIDDNCDEAIDEGFDFDGDGFFLDSPECLATYGITDCDDDDLAVFPGAEDVCNGLDDNCNGLADDLLGVVAGDGGGAPIDSALGLQEFEAEVLTTGLIADLDVYLEIEHTWAGDLDVFLLSPAGTSIELTTDNGGSGDNYGGTTFDDEAAIEIVSGSAPFLGAFIPERGLSNVDGEDTAGIWTLTIEDDAGGDNGVLVAWELIFATGDEDGDGTFACTDCDDEDPAAFPGNPEICDAIDNDCDVATDETVDGDTDTQTVCDGDCDDDDPLVYDGAAELCDGLDNDCDGLVPADEVDADDDGALACADCDDDDPALDYPATDEICDGIDNDCDPLTDENIDADGDLIALCGGDCDETDATIFPGAPELCDGIDNDCNLVTDELVDGDGDGDAACDGDCDDTDAAINEAATEVCDGVDNDCDGALGDGEDTDEDADGSLACADCDDDSAATYPGAPEVCDGFDNDCDGTVLDEELDTDEDGLSPCGGDCDDTAAASFPGADEVCDGLDNDCDDVLPDDESDADADGTSECAGDCDDTDPAVGPDAFEDSPALCADGLDNDCDGDIDADDEDCLTGDDDDSADDDDDSAADDDDDDATDDDDDSAGDDDADCSCENSIAAADAAPGLGLLLLGAVVLRRRR